MQISEREVSSYLYIISYISAAVGWTLMDVTILQHEGSSSQRSCRDRMSLGVGCTMMMCTVPAVGSVVCELSNFNI